MRAKRNSLRGGGGRKPSLKRGKKQYKERGEKRGRKSVKKRERTRDSNS